MSSPDKMSVHSEVNRWQTESVKKHLKGKLSGLFSRKKSSQPDHIGETQTLQVASQLAHKENTNVSVPENNVPSRSNGNGKLSGDPEQGASSNVLPVPQLIKHRSSNSVLDGKQSKVPTSGQENQVSTPSMQETEDLNQSQSGSAYRQAWQSLDEKQKGVLTGEETIESLFEQLRTTDQMDRENSLLRRGLSKVGQYLKKLNFVIDLASPFVSLDVTAGTALGLIKGSASIAIAICGAADDLTDTIEKFLRHIPAIDRCDSIVVHGNGLPDIHHTLVKMYKTLLQFYLETMAIYKESSSNIVVAMRKLKPKSNETLDLFNTYADTLDILLNSEIFASTQELKEGMIDTLIHNTLNIGRDQEEAYHNAFADRADKACNWIEFNNGFSSWISGSSNSHVLAMFGDMGCGKTMTSAYVVDKLSERKLLVCCYYCREGDTTTDLGSIYRSFLWQLLRLKPNLKFRFYQWQKTASSHIDPTRSNVKLREFLFTTILASPEPIFIVLDGLDECETRDLKVLLGFFEDLLDKKALLRVFLSSRYDQEISSSFSSGVEKVEMLKSEERDRVIASYLVKETSVPKAFHQEVVNELAARAEGSAIWLRIALQYLHKLHVSNPQDWSRVLQKLPSSYGGLASLYLDLFEKTCDDVWENKTHLQLALETLAAAHRPLRLYELAYAVFLSTEEGADITTISELDREAISMSLINLVRPFVSIMKFESVENPQLRLVHQSLKELIVWGPPERWPSIGKAMGRRQQPKERSMELSKRLLQCCIRYLLLEDCNEMVLVSNSQDMYEENEFLSSMDPDIFEDGNEETNTSSTDLELSHRFDPAQLGLGHFFTYAASYWTYHFSEVLTELRPEPADLIALCRPGSQRLNNWVYQWIRPNCTRMPEFEMDNLNAVDLDPLVITALFGPAASIADLLLSSQLQPPDFLTDSIWTAVKVLDDRGEILSIKSLLEDKKIGPILQHTGIFWQILLGWSHPRRQKSRNAPEWHAIFDFLIETLRGHLLEVGNEILCLAARNGCLPLIKRLFVAGKRDPELMAAILADNRRGRLGGPKSKSLDVHQSIGEAAWEGHAEVVDFLCQQQGTEHHLRYINYAGHTVFHQWARCPDTQVFRILIRHWPEGVHLKDDGDDTPLVQFIFSCVWPEDDIIEYLKLLMNEGGVDMSGKDAKPWHTPLCTAARRGLAKVCSFLITEGSADIYSLLRVNRETCTPVLIDQVSSAGAQKARDEARLLEELCSLLPLSVSMDGLY